MHAEVITECAKQLGIAKLKDKQLQAVSSGHDTFVSLPTARGHIKALGTKYVTNSIIGPPNSWTRRNETMMRVSLAAPTPRTLFRVWSVRHVRVVPAECIINTCVHFRLAIRGAPRQVQQASAPAVFSFQLGLGPPLTSPTHGEVNTMQQSKA